MSIIGIVFLVLSIVLLGLGFYGASVDVVSAVGLAESIGQKKFLFSARRPDSLHRALPHGVRQGEPARAARDEHHHPLHHPHRRGRVHGLSAAVDDQRHV